MSKEAAEHHRKAAEHHPHAARHAHVARRDIWSMRSTMPRKPASITPTSTASTKRGREREPVPNVGWLHAASTFMRLSQFER